MYQNRVSWRELARVQEIAAGETRHHRSGRGVRERIYTIVGGSGAGRVGLTGERGMSGVLAGVGTGEAAQAGGNKSEHLM
jgi:hypothetical protein